MAKSQRTKDVIKRKNIYCIISYSLWIGTALILAFLAFGTIGGKEAVEGSEEFLSDSAKAELLSVGITAIIGVVAAIIIKDKIRTAIWMACVIIAAILGKEVGMYIVLALWAIDEYVIVALYHKYKNLAVINKEIDARE